MSKKNEVKKVEFNGEMVSIHSLILLSNSKWTEQVGIFSLERFIKKELKLKTSPLKVVCEQYGLTEDKINVDFIKAVFVPSRLVDSKGKLKKKFSIFSWLKDLEKKAENKELTDLLNDTEKFVERSKTEVTSYIELKKAS